MEKSFLSYYWKVVTDASLSGQGEVFKSLTMQRIWPSAVTKLPINILELRATKIALQHWTSGQDAVRQMILLWPTATTKGLQGTADLKGVSKIISRMNTHCPVISVIQVPGVGN